MQTNLQTIKPVYIKTIHTRIAETSLGEDGIIYGIITQPNTHQTLADAIENINALRALSDNRRVKLLSDIRHIKSVDKNVRDYFSSEEVTELIKASAVIVDSLVTKTIMNLYISINKPKYSLRVFTDFEDAVSWLRKQ